MLEKTCKDKSKLLLFARLINTTKFYIVQLNDGGEKK
jgi:hypothetical protein